MIKNTLLYIFSGLFTQGMIFFLWLVLPKFLTTADIGRYTNYLYYIDLFSAFVIVGGDSIMVRYYYSKFEKGVIFSQVIITTLSASISLYIFLFFNNHFNWLSFNFKSDWWLLLLPIIIFLNALTNLCLIHFSADRKAIIYSKAQFVKTVSFVFAAFILSFFRFNAEGLILALIISCIITVLYFISTEFLFIKELRGRRIFSKDPFFYGLPLMFYSIVGVVSLYASRLFLQQNLGLSYTGIFSFFLVIVYQFNGLFSSFNKAWTPEVYARLAGNSSTKFLESSAFALAFFYLSFLLVGSIFGNLFLFEKIFKIEYYKYIHIFLILLTFPLFAGIYTVFYPLFYLENKTQIILILSIISTVINIAILYFFIKAMGMNGAAFGTMLNSIFGLSIYLIYFRKQVNLSRKTIIWLTIIAIGIILSGVLIILSNSFLLFYSILIGLLFVTFKMGNLNRFGLDFILPMIVKFRNRNIGE